MYQDITSNSLHDSKRLLAVSIAVGGFLTLLFVVASLFSVQSAIAKDNPDGGSSAQRTPRNWAPIVVVEEEPAETWSDDTYYYDTSWQDTYYEEPSVSYEPVEEEVWADLEPVEEEVWADLEPVE